LDYKDCINCETLNEVNDFERGYLIRNNLADCGKRILECTSLQTLTFRKKNQLKVKNKLTLQSLPKYKINNPSSKAPEITERARAS